MTRPVGLVVERTGPLTLIQDAGRPGSGSVGVSPSGALDTVAFADANRLVGNAPGTAALEIVLGGAQFRAVAPVWLAVTGAAGSLIRRTRVESPLPFARAFRLDAGESIDIGIAEYGIRYYLAVRGGIDCAPTLGSRSTDLLSALGPPIVTIGDVLPIGEEPDAPIPPIDDLPVSTAERSEVALRVSAGPRLDWFGPAGLATLCGQSWTVRGEANRVGVRFEGAALGRIVDGELPSEGVVTGAIQVPPSGRPILFLADHPTTGGYPVIAVVRTADLPLAAQLRPGQTVRFV